jgi:hypothetical protein
LAYALLKTVAMLVSDLCVADILDCGRYTSVPQPCDSAALGFASFLPLFEFAPVPGLIASKLDDRSATASGGEIANGVCEIEPAVVRRNPGKFDDEWSLNESPVEIAIAALQVSLNPVFATGGQVIPEPENLALVTEATAGKPFARSFTAIEVSTPFAAANSTERYKQAWTIDNEQRPQPFSTDDSSGGGGSEGPLPDTRIDVSSINHRPHACALEVAESYSSHPISLNRNNVAPEHARGLPGPPLSVNDVPASSQLVTIELQCEPHTGRSQPTGCIVPGERDVTGKRELSAVEDSPVVERLDRQLSGEPRRAAQSRLGALELLRITDSGPEHRFNAPAKNDLQFGESGGHKRGSARRVDPVAIAIPIPQMHSDILGATSRATSNSSPVQPLLDAIVNEINGRVHLGEREAILQIDAPELGRLQIDIVVDGKQLSARILTESTEARLVVESHLGELRRALDDTGLLLVDVQVRSDGFGAWSDMNQHPDNEGFDSGSMIASRHAVGTPVEPEAKRDSARTARNVLLSTWA